MNFPVRPGGPSRLERVAQLLESSGPALDRLRERYQVEIYGLEPDLRPLTLQALRTPPRGERTDLLSGLRALAADAGGGVRGLAGVLLFSDGADNADLADGVGPAAQEALKPLGAPVSTFLVGEDALRDLAIQSVKVDDFAFVRNSITVEVEVRGRGFSGVSVPVVLRQEGQVLGTQTVRFQTSDSVARATFTFTPDQTGRFVVVASVPLFPDESVAENNSRAFLLKVIRDRIRALLVVGRPSWDERFLRGLLKSDPNVDLVSFYILRTQTDDPGVRNQERELSLIPFPMEEIFDKKLHTFDVVIFQNFGYEDPSLSIERYEYNLERYVFGGGALVMIGGDRAFGLGQATLTTLGEALPVIPTGSPSSEEPFRPRLSAEGQRHPVTSLGRDGRGGEAVWAALPPLSGLNLTRLKPGATVLLEHPTLKEDGRPAPLLSLWDYGRGRALALATDSTWTWAFTAHREGTAARDYDRLWTQALRWLVRDPELTNVQVAADPSSVEPGRAVAAVITVRSSNYQPVAGAQVHVELVSTETRGNVGSENGTTGPDGTVRIEFPPPGPGAYKLRASAKQGTQLLGEAEDAVAVRAVGPELADASVRPELLKRLAQTTGGDAFVLNSNRLPDVPLREPPVVEVGRSEDQPLWDRWYFLLLLVGLLGAEWFLRRRFGYI
jgi:uncharacterized membrane protein